MRRATAAVSATLLAGLSVLVAEAALAALLVLFARVLNLSLSIQLGDQLVDTFAMRIAGLGGYYGWSVGVTNAGVVLSFLVTSLAGAGAAVWRYRRWSPPA